MSFHTLSVFCATLCFVLVAGQVELPSTIKTCKRDSSDYSSCLRLALQESWPTLTKGIPEAGIPTLDPFLTESADHSFESGELRGKVSVKNVNTYGFGKARFLSVKPEHTENFFRLEVDLELPKLLIDGEYQAAGSLGTFKIGGEGYFNISMKDVRPTWVLEGPIVNDRWVIERFTATPEVGSLKVWFSDLFNGNQELNVAAMAFINQYWPMIYRGMLPYTMEVWNKSLTELANDIFSKLSFSKVFP